jgi:hypothetical protein
VRIPTHDWISFPIRAHLIKTVVHEDREWRARTSVTSYTTTHVETLCGLWLTTERYSELRDPSGKEECAKCLAARSQLTLDLEGLFNE